ncbi:alpha-L-rhamnosidase [Sphingobium sp. AP50]|uniref:glycosyl hydrolase n=1 Tax=Sphingobium sp. AP50 TaxID=1884369 RepID=UPI0008AE88A3|nr:glycosyl hydrolase [Sphingobium sp. AP50]SEK00515.1 alpha-L-rhamnosidase [Sphingobium sp. AP50]
MSYRGTTRVMACLIATIAFPANVIAAPQGPDGSPLWHAFIDPPAAAKPMMRWWWFGPSVTSKEIDREIEQMHLAGIGGFEIQPVYPLSPDDGVKGVKNSPYLSNHFIAALRHAGRTGRKFGMRVHVTGGSGWPFGGPHIPVTQAAAEIRMTRVTIASGEAGIRLPALGPGESILSVWIAPTKDLPIAPADLRPVKMLGNAPIILASGSARDALIFIAGRTGQQVKRPAIGAEGYVLDHIDPAAIANHLRVVGDRLLEGFAGDPPPDAIFSDSLEAYGSSWTGDLPAEFKKRRGYDLMGHLPALFIDLPESAGVRFDWALTLSELVDERYLATIDNWTQNHGTRFRAQVYGFPPPTLSSNALVALPEGEGDNWRGFTSTRWASSAGHLYDKPVISAETWTWLHSPAWAATPLDMKMEADRHFLQGVNQIVGHGWPYSPPEAAEPGWAFYAAAALNDHNPWFAVMPDVSRYLQRVSSMLRQGTPTNDVAIYLPIEDAFSKMRPQKASVNEAMQEYVPDALVGQVLDAGHGFDFVDYQAVRQGRLKHRLLILPNMEHIDPTAFAAIAKWVEGGGKLLVLDRFPRSAGGLRNGLATARIRKMTRRLTRSATVERDVRNVSRHIRHAIGPDMQLADPAPDLGFVHRTMGSRDIYFLVNSGNQAIRTTASFPRARGAGQWWNPMTGQATPAGSGAVTIELAPYESRFMIYGEDNLSVAQPAQVAQSQSLDAGWTLEFDGHAARSISRPHAWTDFPDARFFSGTGTYRYSLPLDRVDGMCFSLDFGRVTPRLADDRARPSAEVDAPIRDAAIVRVNGVVAGNLWAPPYRINISDALKVGRNMIEIAVSNTALNRLAGEPRKDYRLLHARYGERFEDQDVAQIVAQPSGLLATPRLLSLPRIGTRCNAPVAQ